jgi:uncharacterized protein YciI
MPKFAAIIEYIQDKEKVERIRPLHRQYLRDLLAKGNLFATGPFEDGYGALIVYEADTLEQAESFLKGDPFHAEGVFVEWELRPWKVVMGNPALMPA